MTSIASVVGKFGCIVPVTIITIIIVSQIGVNNMNCPLCGCSTTVIDSRNSQSVKNARNRRRKCVNCGHRFSTIEIDRDVYHKRKMFNNRYASLKKKIMGIIDADIKKYNENPS